MNIYNVLLLPDHFCNPQDVLQTFFGFMKIQIGRLMSGDDDVIHIILQFILQLEKRLSDVSFDLVTLNGISDLFSNGKADTKFGLLLFPQNINDKLPIRKRLAAFEHFLEFFILLDPLPFSQVVHLLFVDSFLDLSLPTGSEISRLSP